VVVFAEDRAASTPELVRGVKTWAEKHATEYAAAMRPLREQAELFVEAFAAENVPALIETATTFGAALGELGDKAGVPIVTPRFGIASDLAINLGGAAKPSGAGGGDVGVGLFGDEDAATTFASRVEQLGLRVIDAPLDGKGVHRRLPSANL
jgi:phosphomevalonate kinase